MISLCKNFLRRKGPQQSALAGFSSPDYSALIKGLRRNDPAATQNFDDIFRSGIIFFVTRHNSLGLHLNGAADKCKNLVINQLISQDLGSPSQVPAIVRATVKQLCFGSGRLPAIPKVKRGAELRLSQLGDLGRDALRAFYVRGETESSICERLEISESVFKSYKDEARSLLLGDRASTASKSRIRQAKSVTKGDR